MRLGIPNSKNEDKFTWIILLKERHKKNSKFQKVKTDRSIYNKNSLKIESGVCQHLPCHKTILNLLLHFIYKNNDRYKPTHLTRPLTKIPLDDTIQQNRLQTTIFQTISIKKNVIRAHGSHHNDIAIQNTGGIQFFHYMHSFFPYHILHIN